jgi:hypothetical protein
MKADVPISFKAFQSFAGDADPRALLASLRMNPKKSGVPG